MKINAKETAKILLVEDFIELICHRDPDGDAYGSAMALFDVLVTLGKTVKVSCSSPFPDYLPFLAREFEDFEEKFSVAVDVASTNMLGDGAIQEKRIHLCIDHHPSNPCYADKTFLAPYAAAGEAVFEVIKEMGVPISPFAATAMLTAISADTGSFRYSNTSTQTLRYAAELFDLGADTQSVRVSLFESKGKAQLAVESSALLNTKYYENDRIAVVSVPVALLNKFDALETSLESLPAIAIAIEGVDVGLTLKEREDGTVRISVRTNANADASAIAQEFSGGGHIRASGCRFRGTLEDAEVKLVEVATKHLLLAPNSNC